MRRRIFAGNRVVLYIADGFTYALLVQAAILSFFPMATSAATRTATRYPILLLLLVLGLASLALGTSLVMYVQIRRHELRSGPLRVRTFYSRSNTGVEGMLNKEGIVRADCAPEGMVEVGGELWKARSLGGTLAVGESVVVRDIEGLCLLVERLDSGAA